MRLLRCRAPRRLSLCFFVLVALCCLWYGTSGTAIFRGATDAVSVTSPSSSLPLSPLPSSSPPQSQCAACRDWATCDHAFRGRKGKFCVNDRSGAACCCPMGSWCQYDYWNEKCRCQSMLLGEYTPLVVVFGTLVYLALAFYGCVYPLSSTSSQSAAEHSRSLWNPHSTFAGDTGGGGSVFSGDS